MPNIADVQKKGKSTTPTARKTAGNTATATTSPVTTPKIAKGTPGTAAVSDNPAFTRDPLWTSARNTALTQAIRNGATTPTKLQTVLAAHPAFADVDGGRLTAAKIRTQASKLRKKYEDLGRADVAQVFALRRSSGRDTDYDELARVALGGEGGQDVGYLEGDEDDMEDEEDADLVELEEQELAVIEGEDVEEEDTEE